jgi:DNA topoisomerase-1
MLLFGELLPRIRERVEQDLKLPGMPPEKVLATIVRLLETTLIRVGNEEYARSNGSYGLTTLRNRHVKVQGATLHFHFRGKSGKPHEINVRDRALARIVKRCHDLPGQELFTYLDGSGDARNVSSDDVNQYLQEITGGEHFTAKDFRTWAGTVQCALYLEAFEEYGSETEAKRNVAEAIEEVSALLGNTPAVCRKSYVHPAVIEGYLSGSLREGLVRRAKRAGAEAPFALSADEAAVMAFLKTA